MFVKSYQKIINVTRFLISLNGTFCFFDLDDSLLIVTLSSSFALDSLRQMPADCNKATEIRLLIHEVFLAYCSLFLTEISSAYQVWFLRNSLPILPVVVKTKGVNVPCPMSRTTTATIIIITTILMRRTNVKEKDWKKKHLQDGQVLERIHKQWLNWWKEKLMLHVPFGHSPSLHSYVS